MQPYQKASEAIRSGEERPLHVLKNAGLTALGGAAATLGSRAIGTMIPAVGSLINKYVPDNLMEAGLKKINPKFSTFMEGAKQAGYTSEDLRNYLGEKVEKSQQQEKSKQGKNIIEQYSPNLFYYLNELIKKGDTPVQAAAKAKKFLEKKHQDTISKLEKDHKTNWQSIVESVFGGTGMAQGQQQQTQAQPQQPQPGQGGPGSQALMGILSEINQKLGG